MNASFKLVIDDLKRRQSGSFLGIAWQFIIPIFQICLLWFVFSYGFKANNVNNETLPFIVWLVAGIIAWNFFCDGLISSSFSILDYSFLVKKISFKTENLPLIRVMSSLVIHFGLLILMLSISLINGVMPVLTWLLIPYYSFCLLIFILALGFFTSAVMPFFRDLNNILSLGLQLGFWLTPVFWDFSLLPNKVRFIFMFNPLYYIISGYRNSLAGTANAFDLNLTLVFWVVTLVVFYLAFKFFKRMKPQFADVL